MGMETEIRSLVITRYPTWHWLLWSLVYTVSSILLLHPKASPNLTLSQICWNSLGQTENTVVPWTSRAWGSSKKFPRVYAPRHSVRLCLFKCFHAILGMRASLRITSPLTSLTKQKAHSFLAYHPSSSDIFVLCVSYTFCPTLDST